MLSSRLFPLSSKWLFPKVLQKKSWKDFRLHILATFLVHRNLQNFVAAKIHTKWPLQIMNIQYHPISFKCVLTHSPQIPPRFPDAEHMKREPLFCFRLFLRTFQWTFDIISVGYVFSPECEMTGYTNWMEGSFFFVRYPPKFLKLRYGRFKSSGVWRCIGG